MRKSEQHSLIVELKYLQVRMNRQDLDEFDMLWKRDRDDEDLDAISFDKLKMLYEKYVPKRTKKEVEAQWKNLTSSNKEKGGEEGEL